MHKAFAVLTVAVLFSGAGLQAQNVFVLPGGDSNGSTVSVYVADPFISVTNIVVGAGSYQVVGKPDKSKYYIFSSTSVTSVDAAFQNQKFIANLAQRPTVVLPLADGRRIAMAAGGVLVLDTAVDTITPVPNVNAFDLAANLDGSRIYALNASGNGSVLYAIDPNQLTVLKSLNIGAMATGVSVGPNGLVYVSAQSQLIEIDPTSLTATSGGTIPVTALPGKAAFTPDGVHAVAVNLTPNTGQTSALLFDLPSHTLKKTTPDISATLNSLQVVSNSTIYAYSNQTASLYQLTISNSTFQINPLMVSGLSDSAINAAVLSNEVAVPGTSGATYLFIASGSGTVSRVNIAQNKVDTTLVPASAPGAISYVAPAVTNAAVTTLLSYGGNQTVAPSSTSMPIVVRALDAAHHPIQGVAIRFVTDNPNAHLTTSTVITGVDGYAQTFLNTPATTGVVHVTAETGSKSANYTITVASQSTGGSGGSVLSFVAGQGQILYANFTTRFDNNSPFTVKLTDASGNSVANAKVTFTLASGGNGSFSGGVGTGVPGQVTVNTDKNGIAAIDFNAGPLPQLSPFIQDTITAKASGTNTLTFFLTVTTQSPSPVARITNENPGDLITGLAGTVVKGKFAVQVLAPGGALIPNVSIRIQNALDPTTPPAATCADPTGAGILTDTTGTANCDLMLGGAIGTNTISANVGYQLNTFSVRLKITPGPPGLVKKISGDNQSGKPGTRLPAAIRVQVSDGFGNLLPNVPVSFVATAGLTLAQVSAATDANGNASAVVTLGNSLGPQTVTVTAGTATAVFTETVVTAASNLTKIGDLQTTIIGTPFANPLGVQVTDTQGNPVAGVPLTFTLASGSAILSTTNATTDANGNAFFTVAAGGTAGAIIITATVTGTNLSTTFNLSATPIRAASISATSGNSQTALVTKAFHDPLVVTVADSTGNPVSGVAVTFAIANVRAQLGNGSAPAAAVTATLGTPNALTDANGRASTTVTAGPDAGTITINATTGALAPAVFTLNAILPGPVIKSIVNGASFKPGISPGSIATIIGMGFATDIQGVVTSGAIVGPLQTSLAGVGVNIGGIDAPLFSVSNVDGQEQVTFQVPFELETGTTTLTLTAPNSSPSSKQVNIQRYSPGIFEYAKPGHFAVLIRPDGSYVTQDNPTHPGETVIMFATGLGPTDPPIGTNQAGVPGQNLVGTVVLGVNAKGVNPISVTTYPGVVGVYEVTFTIPQNAKTGPNVQLGLAVKPSPKSKGINAQNVFAPIEQ